MKSGTQFLLGCAIALGLSADSAAAQTQNAEVLKVVTTFFDGMRTKDTAMIRSTIAPNARLMSARSPGGAPVITETPLDGFIASIGRAQGTLDERIFDPEVRIDGNLATVWMRYEFWNNGTFSHCGYNSFQIAMTTAGWKVIHIADSRRTDGCR